MSGYLGESVWVPQSPLRGWEPTSSRVWNRPCGTAWGYASRRNARRRVRSRGSRGVAIGRSRRQGGGLWGVQVEGGGAVVQILGLRAPASVLGAPLNYIVQCG